MVTVDELTHKGTDYCINLQIWHVFKNGYLADVECKIVVMSNDGSDNFGNEYVVTVPSVISIVQALSLPEVKLAIETAKSDIQTNQYQRYIAALQQLEQLSD